MKHERPQYRRTSARSQPSVLVVGGAGLVGAHVASALIRQSRPVVSVDNELFSPSSVLDQLVDSPHFTYVVADARNGRRLDELLEARTFNAIVNCVGPARPSYYRMYPAQTASSILGSTHQLLELARRHKATFVHASSSEVYGDAGRQKIPESYVGSVDTLSPRAAYAEAKRASETLVWQYARQFDLVVRVLRLFNIYGPHFGADDDRIIPNVVKSLRRDLPVVIQGNGLQVRSFCHVQDAADAFVKAIAYTDAEPLCVNIGNPEPVAIIDLVRRMADAAGVSARFEFHPRVEDEIDFRCPEIERAMACLEWEPTIMLSEGIRSLGVGP